MSPASEVALRPATPADVRPAYEWMCRSDVTACMMGRPEFPDQPVPSWEKFQEDWEPHYFDGTAPELGRCFVILVDAAPAGIIAHGEIWTRDDGTRFTEIDIWMRSLACCGHGYGSRAVGLFCALLEQQNAVGEFVMQPSARNPRAIRAYQKAGFARLDLPPVDAARRYRTEPDYQDSVFLVKRFGSQP
jgi:diamine N-acetyltransferase